MFVDSSLVVKNGSTSDVKDALRLNLNQIWRFDQEDSSLGFSPMLKIIDNIPYSVKYGKVHHDQRQTFLEQHQEIEITGKPIFNFLDFDGEKWQNQINALFSPTEEYINEDHVFEADNLYSEKELMKANESGFSPPYIKVNGEYNFYIEQYENLTSNSEVSEALLPNLYAFASEKRNPKAENEDPSDYHRLITLDGALPSDIVNPKSISANSKRTIETESTHQYFDLWTKRFFLADTEKKNILRQKYTNMYFSHEDVSMIKDHVGDFAYFPMGVKIEFSTDKSSAFSEILRETNLFDSFMYDVVEHFESLEEAKRKSRSGLINTILSLPTTVKKFTLFQDEENFAENGYETRYRQALNTDVFVMDLTSWWESLGNFFSGEGESLTEQDRFEDLRNSATQQTSRSPRPDFNIRLAPTSRRPPILKKRKLTRSVYFGKKEPMLIGRDPEQDFVKNLMLMIFNGKVRNLIYDKMRSYEQVADGNTAYTETVFYRISKHLVVDNVAQEIPVQNFYIPNSKDYDVMDFVDTQVKYGNNFSYKYVVKAYNLVVGTKYRFLEPEYYEGEYKAKIKVKSRPSLQIVEVPIYEKELAVLDDAPMHPNVEVIPFRGVSNKIKFNFQANVGSYKAQPILVQGNTDFNWAFNYRKKRGLEEDDPIQYSSDDHYGSFQIFKTDVEPNSFTDFSNKKIEEITNDVIGGQSSRAASAGSFEDTIQPNKKYYYVFRAVDVHGNISNPSPIYEVEMVDDNGAVIPRIQILRLTGEPDPVYSREPSMPFRQFLKVEPSFLHTVLNIEASGLPGLGEPLGSYNLDNIVLGSQEQAVWGKTFKIRITSKSTGKKVDLNITLDTASIKKGNF